MGRKGWSGKGERTATIAERVAEYIATDMLWTPIESGAPLASARAFSDMGKSDRSCLSAVPILFVRSRPEIARRGDHFRGTFIHFGRFLPITNL
jgi:hypothetical protein